MVKITQLKDGLEIEVDDQHEVTVTLSEFGKIELHVSRKPVIANINVSTGDGGGGGGFYVPHSQGGGHGGPPQVAGGGKGNPSNDHCRNGD